MLDFEEIKIATGQRLAELRKYMGYQQRPQFAKILDVTPVTLGNYERGSRKPALGFLLLYVDRFNANLHWLLTGEGEMFVGKNWLQSVKNVDSDLLQKAVGIVENFPAEIKLTADKKAEVIKLIATMLKNEQDIEPIKHLIALLR